VAALCRVLDVSSSGYYAWLKRPPSKRARENAALKVQIEKIHERSRGTYGSPRVHAELAGEGERVGRNRVARLMREAGLEGASRRRGPRTTRRDRDAKPAPDLVERDFVAVGWSMATHLRTELVLEALNMALWQRRPQAVVHHSDQGTQYTSITFGQRCKEVGVRPSMGSAGDCFDNALCESFFATLECELLDRRRFRTQAEAKMAIFEFIEGWYNPHRRHSALGYQSPTSYERRQKSAA
jgi:putative transposase